MPLVDASLSDPGGACTSRDTSSMPSGLACTARMITSRRKRIVSSSVAADELIDRLHQLLRAEHLGGMQAAVDPDDRLAVARELPRLVVGQPLGQCEPPGDVLVLLQVLVVLRRGDDRHQLVAALGGLADALHGHAVGVGVELAEELGELGVVRQHVVGADLMAEELLRGRDLGGACCAAARRRWPARGSAATSAYVRGLRCMANPWENRWERVNFIAIAMGEVSVLSVDCAGATARKRGLSPD